MTVLHEATAWATSALRARFAVTQTLTSHFQRPVLVDQPHTVRDTCGLPGADGRPAADNGVTTRGGGTVCVLAKPPAAP